MRILHFGDIHFWRLRFDRDFYYPKRILGMANLTLCRRHRFPPRLAREAMAGIAGEEADMVLFSGDMTTMSLEGEFRDAARAFAPLYEKWGDRLVVIPGNHDRYSPRSARLQYFEKHFPRAALQQGQRVFSRQVGDHVSVVGFDASRPFMMRSNGLFDENLERELDRELEAAGECGRKVLLMGHFPYSYPGKSPGKWHHRLLREEVLAKVIARHQPAAYLHGHKHVRWCLRDSRSPQTLCLNCGPAGMYSVSPDRHAGWLTFELSEDGALSDLNKVSMGPGGDLLREALTIPPALPG
ncbi:MAG: metallophosphoesterase [Verrucomicrobiales bacterium]